MNEESLNETCDWRAILHNQYKHLFVTHDGINITRGIECGKGWRVPVTEFLKCIDTISSTRIKIFQIKEKFGYVRCYVDFPKKYEYEVALYIGRLEGLCSVTCEQCGKVQNDIHKNINDWYINLCDRCFNETNERTTNE